MIVLAPAARVARQGGDVPAKETVNELTSILDKIIDVARGILGAGGKGGQRNQRGMGEPAEKVTKGLKDLIGPNRERG